MPQNERSSAHGLNLRWLLRLRWLIAGLSLVVIGAAERLTDIGIPVAWLLAVVGVSAVTNVAATVWVRGRESVDGRVLTLLMGVDVVVLTALLYLTGGPTNPFTVLYLVYVALAAATLSYRATWLIGGLSVAGFGSLFLDDDWKATPHAHHDHSAMGHSMNDAMDTHLIGMWVAFAFTAVFIVYFLNRVLRALSEREAQLSRERQRTERSTRLASLATLAAGAAHELSTPLSTIAVVAKELERQLERSPQTATAEDARLIRAEVDRCRTILEHMAADAGRSRGEAMTELTARELLEEVLTEIHDERIVLRLDDCAELKLETTRTAVAQVLRGIVRNAGEASGADDPIHIDVSADEQRLRIEVKDSGRGMSAEQLEHATDPFFTTKEPGEGMGLGLFLATEVLERVGGTLELESAEGRGTTTNVGLPLGKSATALRRAS